MTSKTAAQERANAIRVFQDELSRLEAEGGLSLTPEQRQQLEAHQQSLLAGLGKSFDIDRTAGQAQLSNGMRVASFLGAVALSASVVLLFQQFWGRLGTPLQILILVGAAVGTFMGALAIHKRDTSGYFTGLAAMVAFACFVLDLGMIGQIFNIAPSPDAFLVWGALAFVIAYTCDLKLLLVPGIVCIGIWLPARGAALSGVYWTEFIERPENLLVPAAVIFAVPRFVAHRDRPEFPAMYRGFGLAAAFIIVLALASAGELSYVRADKAWIESTYQWIGFIGSASVVWIAIRRGWTESVNVGVAAFIVFLFIKYVSWWWETMPRYLFFLVVGLTAVLIIMVLRRIRAATAIAMEQPV